MDNNIRFPQKDEDMKQCTEVGFIFRGLDRFAGQQKLFRMGFK